ncbi:MAG: gliding motility-associated C-terminal domain-containing protein, partial [Bacteroidetes bacterium]
MEADRQGCKARDTIEVEVLGEVPLELGNDTVLCAGETLMLQAQILADDFLWSTGSTATSISVTEPGTYWVEATAGQCKVADTIQVNFLTIEFDLGEDLLLCEGEQTTLDATVENASYFWQDGSTAPTYTVTEPGTYWVQVGESGCFEFDTVQISYQYRPDSILPNYEYICENEVIWLEPSIPGASYIWNDGSQNSKLRVIQPGDYRVTVLLNGCSFEDAISLRPCESCLYVPNAFSPDGNGINDVFLSFPVCEIFNFEMKVFDRWGNLLFESSDPSMGWDGRFKGKKLQ